jgi:broad specificity phosphatase PhoE/ribonuclease HI
MAEQHARVVVEADGGSRGNPGPAAYGSVLRDADTGEVIAETGEAIGVATNNVAEYRGLIGGLELYQEHTPDAELEVRMDSKLVVEQMAGRWKVKHPAMRPLAIEAHALAPPSTRWTWVPRDQNKHADRLVNEALDGMPTATAPAVRAGDRDRGATVRRLNDELASDPPAEASPAPVAHRDTPAFDEAPSIMGARNPLLGWSGQLGQATTLLLVRHGATVHTAARRFSGPGGDNPGLNDLGREQAVRVAEYLRNRVDERWEPVNAVVSSPMRRATETASVIGSALGLPIVVDDDLREAAFGDWDGLTLADVEARWPTELDTWIGSFDAAPPGGGESIAALTERVDQALTRLRVQYEGQTVVVVSHVNPIKRIVQDVLGAQLDVMNRMQLVPGSISAVQFFSSGTAVLRSFSTVV